MTKSFSGQVVFWFAILRAISAYVGENWLSQSKSCSYMKKHQTNNHKTHSYLVVLLFYQIWMK